MKQTRVGKGILSRHEGGWCSGKYGDGGSLASENASRLAAMQRADKNINELLEDLGGKYHRLWQSGIDEELFDVTSGFETQTGS